MDLRFDVGATATIFVEYLDELAALDPDVEEDRRIATAVGWIAEGKSRNWKYERPR